MINFKTLNRLALITCLIAVPVVIIFLNFGGSAIKYKNEPLYPNLNKELTNVTEIQIKTQNENLTLVRNGSAWGIAARQNYPVQPERVQDLLQAVAALKIMEAKTTNSLLYEQLDLSDLTVSGSKAWQIVLQDDKQQEIANMLIGKREAFETDNQYSERIFIRKAGDQQAWLVQGLLPLDLNVRDWLVQPMQEVINEAQIKRITLSRPESGILTIAKASPEQEDFTLQDAPTKPGMKLDNDAVNTLPYEMVELEFDDIVPASESTVDWSKAITAEVETFPGLALDLNIIQDADKKSMQRCMLKLLLMPLQK